MPGALDQIVSGPEASQQAGQPDIKKKVADKMDPRKNGELQDGGQEGRQNTPGGQQPSQPEGNQQNQQPPQGGQQAQSQQPQQNQGVNQQTEPEPDRTEVTENSDFEDKKKYIKRKFNSPEEVEQSIEELHNKLGIDSSNVQLNSDEEVIDHYIKLERQMGEIGRQTGNVDEYAQENRRLKDGIKRMNQRIQALTAQLNQQQNQQSNQPIQSGQQPQNAQGQYNAQQQAQGQSQQQNQQLNVDLDNLNLGDIDQKQFLREFYKDGPKSQNFKKAIANIASQVSKQQMNQLIQQMSQRNQQQQQQNQAQRAKQKRAAHLRQQADSIRQRDGKEEFNRYKQDIIQVMNEYPVYQDPNIFPDGVERAYLEAKRRRRAYSNQQQTQLQNQQQQNIRKQAASMPGSQNNATQRLNDQQRQMSPEEIEKQQILQKVPQRGVLSEFM